MMIMLPLGNRNFNFYRVCVEVCADGFDRALGLVTSYKNRVEV